jgi:hypothetical protein
MELQTIVFDHISTQVRKMASAVMEMRIFDPIHALWKSTFKDQSRTSPGQFNMTSEPSNLVQLQMRYTVMRKRDAELWDKQKTIVFSGVAPTAPILLPFVFCFLLLLLLFYSRKYMST